VDARRKRTLCPGEERLFGGMSVTSSALRAAVMKGVDNRKPRISRAFVPQGRQDSNLQPPVLETGTSASWRFRPALGSSVLDA
jgi:hypothetical protein